MKPRVNLRLKEKLHNQLSQTAAMRGCSKTEILEEALSNFFDPERNRALEQRVVSELRVLELRMASLEKEAKVTKETIGHFVFYWLVKCDPIPKKKRDKAHELGRRRFAYFEGQVAKIIGQGGKYFSQAK